MIGLISFIIIVASVLLVLVVYVQNPKGGGLSTDFGAAHQMGGVQKTNDFIDKATWSLAAVIAVLVYFSEATQIQQYLFWSFGSLGNLSWSELSVFGSIYLVGVLACLSIIKPLNSFLLGENYAKR